MAISFDETTVRHQVTELRNIASDMKKIANNEMQNTINTTKASWKGTSADNFCNKYNTLSGNILKEANNIDSLAASLEKLANAIVNAERQAESIVTGGLIK